MIQGDQQRTRWALAVHLQQSRLRAYRKKNHDMRASREDVEHVIGEVDEFMLESILAVGANKEELHEAALAAVMLYEMGEPVARPSNARVDALCTIIEELLSREAEEEQREIDAYTSAESREPRDRW